MSDHQKRTIFSPFLSNTKVALKGVLLKREQMLSGTMADIFSNLYLALSVQYYHNHYNASLKLTDYIINKLVNENKKLINCVISSPIPLINIIPIINPALRQDDPTIKLFFVVFIQTS